MPTNTVTFVPVGSDAVPGENTPTASTGAALSNYWQLVDEDYTSPDGDTLYNTDFTTSNQWVRLYIGPMPLTFGTLLDTNSVTIRVYITTAGDTGAETDSVDMTVLLRDGNGSTVCNSPLLISAGSPGPETQGVHVGTAATAVATSLADMNAGNGSSLDVRWSYFRSMGADNCQVFLDAIEVDLTYETGSKVMEPAPDTLTFQGYAPTVFETVLVHRPPVAKLRAGSLPSALFPGELTASNYYYPFEANRSTNFSGAFTQIDELTDSWTVEAWVRVELDSMDLDFNVLSITANGGPYHTIIKGNAVGRWSSQYWYGDPLPLRQWVHHVVTWDGPTSTIRYYRNGQLYHERVDNTLVAMTNGWVQVTGYENDAPWTSWSYETPAHLGELRVTENINRYGSASSIPVPTDYFPADNTDPNWGLVSLLVNFKDGTLTNLGNKTIAFEGDGGDMVSPSPPTLVFTPGFWLYWDLKIPEASLAFTGYPPVITTGVAGVSTGSLEFVGRAPQVPTLSVPGGSLSTAGYAPIITVGQLLEVGTGATTVTGLVPTAIGGTSSIAPVPECHTAQFPDLNSGFQRSYSMWYSPGFYWPDYTGQTVDTVRPRMWYTLWGIYDLEGEVTFWPARPSLNERLDIEFGTDLGILANPTPAADSIATWAIPGPLCEIVLADVYALDGSGTFNGWEGQGLTHYASHGGPNGQPYACASLRDHLVINASSTVWTPVIFQPQDNVIRATTVKVGPLPWYDTNEHANWTGRFYAVDASVGNEEGYLLGLEVVGADTLPTIYKWTGGTTWDSGTNLIDGAEEAVAYITDIVGWCRASTTDVYKYYAIVTTRNASTDAFLHFKILAVQLDTMSITKVLDDNVDHGGNGAWYLGYGHGGTSTSASWQSVNWGPLYECGTTVDEERCEPIDYNSEKFFIFRTYGDSGQEQYTRVILNDSNWLAPSYDVRDANLPTTYPDLAPDQSSYSIRRWLNHHIMWDSENDTGVYAAIVCVRGNQSTWDRIEYAWSYRSLMETTGPDSEFNDFQIIQTRSWPQVPESVISGVWKRVMSLYGGTRNWAQYNGYRMPIFAFHSFMNSSGANWSEHTGIFIHWWSPGNNYNKDVTINLNMGLDVSVTQTGYQSVPVHVDLGLGASFPLVERYGGLYFTGNYELQPAQAVIDASVHADLGLAVDVSDDNSVTVIINADLGFSATVTEEVQINFRQRYLGVNNDQWGLDWVDDLLVYVNAVRSAASLEPFRAIDYIDDQRVEQNQNGIDPPHLVAKDLARRDSTTPFDGTDYYTNSTNFIIGINANLFTYFTERVSTGIFEQLPTAQYMWDVFGWDNYTSIWEFDGWNTDGTELYLQVGMHRADSPSTGGSISPRENAVFMYVVLSDYTGKPFEPYGGPGGGGPTLPTPHPITQRALTFAASVHGVTWMEEFVAIQNEARADVGLPPYRVPDLAFFQLYPTDVTRLHCESVHDTQIFNHEDPAYPSDIDTMSERGDIAGYKEMSENLILNVASPYHDPDNPGNFTYYDILSDYTFITPQEAFTLWWNSPGHKAAILRDWGARNVYSLCDWTVRQRATPTTYTNTLYPGNPTYDLQGQVFVLNNNFCDVTVAMATRYLNVNYQLTGAMVEVLDISYDLTAYVDVKNQHTLSYALRVAAQHNAPYVARASNQHKAPIFYGLTAEHVSPYGDTGPVRAAHQAPYRYDVLNAVAQAHTALYAGTVKSAHEAQYTSTPAVRTTHEGQYGSFSFVRVAHESQYGQPGFARAGHEAQYGSPPFVSTFHEAPYTTPAGVSSSHTGVYAMMNLLRADHLASWTNTTTVATDHDADYTLSAVEPVSTSHKSFYSMLADSTSTERPVVTLTKGATIIDLGDMVISQDEGDAAWVARARIDRQEDFVQLAEGDAVTLTIGLESWALLITELSVRRSEQANTQMELKAESPVVNLIAPRATVSSYSYDTAQSAKTIVEDILGQAVDWRILDWTVGAGKVAVDNATPFEAAKKVVEAAGGIMQSKRDGTLLVRYEYPVAMNTLYNVPADEVFTDIEDNLSAIEGFEFRSGVNNIRIMDGESTFKDRLKWVVDTDDPSRGVLEAYLSPWRQTYSVVYTDSDGSASIQFAGTVTREEQELVEFRNGTANVAYPVKEIKTVEWESDSLGAVTFNEFSTTLNTGTGVNQGFGLAEVTYVVQLDTYNVTGVLGTAAQFIIEDGG